MARPRYELCACLLPAAGEVDEGKNGQHREDTTATDNDQESGPSYDRIRRPHSFASPHI